MFPKKYSKDSSGRTFRLMTILGFCGVFPVLARESIFVMGAWKTETNNKTCMAYMPTWIVMMMSCIKASSKWKPCDMPCPTVFRDECLRGTLHSDEVPGWRWSSNLFEDVWRDQQPLQSKIKVSKSFSHLQHILLGGSLRIHLWPPIWTKDDRCSTLKPGVTRLLIKTHKNALDKFAVIFVSMFTSHLPPFSYWMTSFKRRLSSHLPSSWTSSPSLLPNVDPIAPTFAEDCFFSAKGERYTMDHHNGNQIFEKSSAEPGAVLLFLAKTEIFIEGVKRST